MKFKATVTPPTIRLRIDTERTAVQIADQMGKFWAANFRAGKLPDGSPLPVNKKGQPLGVGGGYLIRSWRTRTINRHTKQTSTAVVPSDRGRRLIAIKALAKRGVAFQGLDGESGDKWRSIVQRIVKQVVATAMANSGKKGRTK